MRFTVETWAPEYGIPGRPDPVEASVEPEVGVELSASRWRPLLPDADPAREVVFVDGVRRVDASVWIDQPGRVPQLGLCATFAAGAVSCDGRSEVIHARVERGLFTAALGAEDVETRHARYRVQATAGTTAEKLWLGIQQRMGELEGKVSGAMPAAELVVVDGPLSHHRHVPNAVGYVKTQHVHYLPEPLRGILVDLPAGRRTPLFLVATGRSSYSWYLRLAAGSSPMAGVVRCEVAAGMPPGEAARLADRVTATLPPFSSHEHKDPRAPQNLYPIGGLERDLRRRLGDPQLLYRSLRAAAG